GLAFLLGVISSRWHIGGLPAQCQARRCQATAVFTNPGRLFDQSPLNNQQGQIALGSATLASVDFLAPIRRKTNIALAVHSYAGQLQFTLHDDPFSLTPQQSQALLDDFMERLQSMVEKG
ncbi:hypothetical protein ACFL6U_28320, partial [Planctomycetota bacterium]